MVRPLDESELAAGADTLAASFHDDPLYSYMVPKPERRRRFLRAVMEGALRSALPEGCVVVAGDGPAFGVMGAVPPGRYPLPPARVRRNAFGRRPWWRPPIVPTYRMVRAGIGMLGEMERLHILEPHYYLQVIGVHPDAKGRGVGGELVRYLIGLADADRVPVYLETSNENNLGFYRRYGFEVVEEFACPGGGPMSWSMLRPG